MLQFCLMLHRMLQAGAVHVHREYYNTMVDEENVPFLLNHDHFTVHIVCLESTIQMYADDGLIYAHGCCITQVSTNL